MERGYVTEIEAPSLGVGYLDKIESGLKSIYGFFREHPKETIALFSLISAEAILSSSINLYEPVRHIGTRISDIGIGFVLGKLSVRK